MFVVRVFGNLKLTKCILKNLPLNPAKLKRHLADHKKPTQSPTKAPYPPKDPPDDYNPTKFTHKAFQPENLPLAAFRPFTSPDEQLGPGAEKSGTYKCPEYFAYHRFSFHTLQKAAVTLARNSTGEQVLYDYESGFEEEQQEDTCNGNGKDDKDSGKDDKDSGEDATDSGKEINNAKSGGNDKDNDCK